VLLPEYRGRGIGHVFFDEREAQARALGLSYAAFCAVVREPDHPSRPASARDLAPFWRARGYQPVRDALAYFSWKDLNQMAETQKPLQLWLRPL
jgi:GNAT superfamily N-acetyltransferase